MTALDNGTAQIWDARTFVAVGMPLQHQGVVRASFGANGTLVMTASADEARIWDARTGRAAGALLTQQDVVRTASQAINLDIVISPATFTQDGTLVMFAANGTARIWEASTGRARNLPLQREGYRRAPRLRVRPHAEYLFNRDGTRILTVPDDGTARVWDAATGETTGANLPHQGSVRAAALSADGNWVLTSVDSRTVTVRDAQTGQVVSPPLPHSTPVLSASFNEDGSKIVTTSTNTVRVWETRTEGGVAEPMSHQRVTAAFFSPDGSRVVSVSSDRVRVWNARTNEALGAMQQQAPLTAFSFNANGTRLVTASLDGIARVWESQTGRPVGRPLRHLDAGRSVTTAAFSADGTRVVTASQTTAKIWDTQTGLEIHAPLLHQAQGLAAVFSADGTRVVTASGDGTARVWDTQVGTPADSVPLADLAEALGGLRLTETDSFEPIENVNDRLATLRQRAARTELGQPGAASFMRWFFEEPWTRPLSPLLKMTVVEYIDRMVAMGDRGRAEAERAFLGHPSLRVNRP